MPDRRPESRPNPSFVPSGFFALRTPLLPFHVLSEWRGEGPSAPGAGEAPGARLRAHLRRWVEEPLVREALFLASPSLEESLPVWFEAPESERGQKVERSLVRYFARMAGRATPFGLFATHAVGRMEEHTRLRLAERSAIRKHTRLDMDYVCALVERTGRTPEVRRALRYVPNSSTFRTPLQLRYLEARQRERARTYHLVAAETTPYLESTLARARGGATLGELAEALVARDADIPLEDALRYVEVLVEAQVLVPTWAPTVTGPPPVAYLLSTAQHIPALAPLHEQLSEVQARLEGMSREPGTPPEAYRRLARSLEALPVPVSLPRLFQVDAARPDSGLTLSRRVVDTVLEGVEALRRLTPRADESDALVRFRQRFAERYEERSVPLLEALDEERGLGLKAEARLGASTSPLLQGLPFQPLKGREPTRLDRRWGALLRRVEEAWREGAHELALTAADLEALEPDASARLPDAFGVMGTLVSRSAQAVDEGDFRFVLEHVHGPSGARLLGRFCHDEPELEAHVRAHLRAEEQLHPEALFAEVVHLPQDRMGNVICRPALRSHELVFLGQSGVPHENQIGVEDLWLSLEAGRLVLRSRRLGREIIPRMSNAHSYNVYGVGVYRFLGLLQNQDSRPLKFQWGPLSAATFLPRVTSGRTVLSLARWSLGRARIREWYASGEGGRHEAFQRSRERDRLPRWVCLKDGDNVLPLDLDNPLCLETFLHTVKDRPSVLLEELYPGPDGLCVESGEGRHVHELVVPFVRQAPAPAAREPAPRVPEAAPRPRRFPPGSEWLYAKLYTGTATADRLLRTTLREAVQRLKASGAVERWFFLRYADPEHHLRLRFHGVPQRLESEVWPALRTAFASLFEQGEAWRLQLDTYEREVERYGGFEGVELAEALFAADSDAALTLLGTCGEEAEGPPRWHLVLQGMDALLEDLGLSVEARLRVVGRMRENFAQEFSRDRTFEERLGLRFRGERKAMEALLAAPRRMAFQRRSERVRPVGEALGRAWREERLTLSPEALAGSLLHMHANRLLAEEQRAQELVLYEYLERLYRSRLARGVPG